MSKHLTPPVETRQARVGDVVTLEVDGKVVFDVVAHIGKHTIKGRRYDLSYVTYTIVELKRLK